LVPLSVALVTAAPAWRGSGTSFAKIALGLERAGHRATVIVSAEAMRDRLAALGVRAVTARLDHTRLPQVRQLRQAFAGMAPDVILADTPRDLRLATLASAFRVPLIFRYNLSRRALPADLPYRLVYLRIGLIAYQSVYARERALGDAPWLARWPGHVIPNGFDAERHRPDGEAGERFRRANGIDPHHPVVVSGAALFFEKGYAVGIDALAQVASTGPVTWVVCGAGRDAAAIAAGADRAGLRVVFPGVLDDIGFSAALSAADVVLHPGLGELFGNVVAEGMLQGRPVVAMDSGATPEIIGRDQRTGLLVPPDDARAMAAAIDGLLRDPARREAMGAAARERIIREFPLERMERAYVSLVETLGRPR
jgi:glycosyltransferase involved in cell wall biosynthesis